MVGRHGDRESPIGFVHRNWRYLSTYLIGFVLVMGSFFVQTYLILDEITLFMTIVPFILANLIGFLLAALLIIKDRGVRRKAMFSALVDVAQAFIYYRSENGFFEYVSPGCRVVTGYEPNDFYRDPNLMKIIIHPEDRGRWEAYERSAVTPERAIDVRIRGRDGTERWLAHYSSREAHWKGRGMAIRASNIDITERVAYEEMMARLAQSDPLTELPNRRKFTDDSDALLAAYALDGRSFALLFIDLDRFRVLNDTHGHAVGDEVLYLLSRRLHNFMREMDNGTRLSIYRFGGDEFVALLVPPTGMDAAHVPDFSIETAGKIIDLLSEPVSVHRLSVHVSAVIGIAICPTDGTRIDILTRRADAAMYRAREMVQQPICLASRVIDKTLARRLTVEHRLHRALEMNDIFPVYQPQVDLATGAVIGIEALARWMDEELGEVPPLEFIPIAEEMGLIEEISEALIRQIVRDAAAWLPALPYHKDEHPDHRLTLAVNISPHHLLVPRFLTVLDELFPAETTSLPRLVVEVTENVVLEASPAVYRVFDELHNRGHLLALDNFGAGFSTVRNVHDFDVDILKIDRRFLQNIERDDRVQAIVDSIQNMCDKLNILTIAEGIETLGQRTRVQAANVQFGQGWLFAHPMTARALLAYLKADKRLQALDDSA